MAQNESIVTLPCSRTETVSLRLHKLHLNNFIDYFPIHVPLPFCYILTREIKETDAPIVYSTREVVSLVMAS